MLTGRTVLGYAKGRKSNYFAGRNELPRAFGEIGRSALGHCQRLYNSPKAALLSVLLVRKGYLLFQSVLMWFSKEALLAINM